MLQCVAKSILLFAVTFIFYGCESSGSSSGSDSGSIRASDKSENGLRSAPAFTGVDGSRGGAHGADALIGMADVEPYYNEGPYAQVLKSCALITDEKNSCELRVLPFIGMDYSVPSVDQVMSRVLVSHQWMGDNFREALTLLPRDILLLFKSTTAIVIATDIRPSYYWAATGAVYIDPDLLWLEAIEKQAISNFFVPAYSSQKNEIPGLRSWWRYIHDEQLAFADHSLFDNRSRSMAEALLPLASLLFHELAHANDFFAQEYFSQLHGGLTVAQAAMEQLGHRPSDKLYQHSPLHSELMFDLAESLYGTADRDLPSGLSIQDVALAFASDDASDDYAYVSQHEDFAMLMEETLMKLYFDVDRDAAYLSAPKNSVGANCDDFKIAWGMRSRISSRNVAPRAEYVVRQVLPHKNWSTFFNELPAAEFLPADIGWCNSISGDIQNFQPVYSIKPQSGYVYTD